MAKKVDCVPGTYRKKRYGKAGMRCVCTSADTGKLIIRPNTSCKASKPGKKEAKKVAKKRCPAGGNPRLKCPLTTQVCVRAHWRCR